LLTGLICFGPQLGFFWRIFGPAAIALWAVLALWIALLLALAHVALVRPGARRAALLLPFLWMGPEYFRGELYYLRFAWLNVGFAFKQARWLPFQLLGVYGVGFLVATYAALYFVAPVKRMLLCSFIVLLLAGCLPPALSPAQIRNSAWRPQIAGVQLEFPNDSQIKRALDNIVATHTNVDLIILNEYTLDAPPAENLKSWCREHQKFLVVGGKDPAPDNNFYNTASVGTNGAVIFKQIKSVPIQFFKDGSPAPEQKLWESPWGKIGIYICYALGYARVTDELVRQGAQLLIVPTMDMADWGRHQHELQARIAPVRAAEYGVPIFRLASSGISQGVNRSREVRTTVSRDGETIFFNVSLKRKGSWPMDRYLAPLAVLATGAFVVRLIVVSRKTLIKAPETPS
jgi:apolipoprotein N-acyltransferase